MMIMIHQCHLKKVTSSRTITLNPVSAMTTPDSPESSLSTNQGRGEMMQCPLTN